MQEVISRLLGKQLSPKGHAGSNPAPVALPAWRNGIAEDC